MNNNVLEFFVKMKDLMSGGLAKVAQNAKKTFNSIDGFIDKSISKMKQLSHSFDGFGGKLANFFKGGGSSTGGGIAKQLWGALKGFGIAGAITGLVGTAAIASVVKEGVDKAIAFESTKKSFEVLTGSKSQGLGLANNLNALQRDTILGPEVFKSAQTLLAFGVATDKVMPSLKMLGDVSMGDAEKLNSLTLAFAQTNSAGKLTGQDLLQYVNAGFNPLNEMARTTGKSMGELRKEMEKGNITSAMVVKAFETATGKGGKFNDMMNQMADTTGGKIAMLEGQIENDMIKIGDKFKDASVLVLKFKAAILDLVAGQTHLQDSIVGEKSSLNTLVGAITNVNTNNEVRLSLLGDLQKAYPDLFSKLDIEKVKNGELLGMLDDINAAYDKRIKYATNKDNLQQLQKDADEAFKNAKFFTEMGAQHGAEYAKPGKAWEETYKSKIAQIQAAKNQTKVDDITQVVEMIKDFAKDDHNLTLLGKNRDKFLHTLNEWRGKGFLKGGGAFTLPGMVNMISTAVNAASGVANPASSADGKSKSGGSIASGITGGGPRVININGVNMKLADNIHVKAGNTDEFMKELEPAMEDFYLRILNSGAAVQ